MSRIGAGKHGYSSVSATVAENLARMPTEQASSSSSFSGFVNASSSSSPSSSPAPSSSPSPSPSSAEHKPASPNPPVEAPETPEPTPRPVDVQYCTDEKSKCVVPLNFVKIAAKKPSESPRPPIIVLHGVFASSGTYRSVLKRPDFAPSRDIYALDLRNHGGSPQVSEMSYEGMVEDLDSFVDDHGFESVCLVGHSMGAKVAMLFALDHPEKVSNLILVDSVPKAYEKSDTINISQAMFEIDLEKMRHRKDVDVALEEKGVKDPKIRNFVMTNLITDDKRPGFYEWRVNMPVINDAIKDILSFPPIDQIQDIYTGPTLVMSGERSPYVKEEDRENTLKLFPGSQFEVVPESGHWILSDNPDAVTTLVNSFLGEDVSEKKD
eukprot:CAMPEP_0184699682 /NCGR_PEP_ID=MMETSP0313-20130426/5862_1 /TAXON_ID=2792 /ORGANISM="Porphyridium aerugineum, Strain SAG 1380-2" /LENGTH=379 /DNA_ID=CAMNT_0027158805 /DNA_START=395 /DNA_END=1534 /DNA_ORIENTATION=-